MCYDVLLRKPLRSWIVFLFIVFFIFAAFLAASTAAVAIDLSKSLVEADSALLGFLGIITVFVYNTYRDEIRFTEEKKEDLIYDHENYARDMVFEAGYEEKHRQSMLEKEYATFKAETGKLEKRLKGLRKSSKESFAWTIYSATSFVISIFLALLAMAALDLLVRFAVAYFAVGLTGVGILFLFIMIWELRAGLG